MDKIIKSVLEELDLTIYEVLAGGEAKDILEAISDFYGNSPTKNLIWDKSHGNLGSLNIKDFQNFHAVTRQYVTNRQGGTTFFISNSDVEQIFLKFIRSFSENEPDFPINVDVVSSQKEAFEMLRDKNLR